MIRELDTTVLTWFYVVTALVTIGFMTRLTADLGRLSLAWGALTAIAGMLVTRCGIRWLQKLLRYRGFNTRSFAIVAITELGIRLAKNLEQSPELGLKLLGFYDDHPSERRAYLPPDIGRHVGTVGELIERARAGKIDRVYVTFPMRAENRIRSILDQLADTTTFVYIVPDFLSLSCSILAGQMSQGCRLSACLRILSMV